MDIFTDSAHTVTRVKRCSNTTAYIFMKESGYLSVKTKPGSTAVTDDSSALSISLPESVPDNSSIKKDSEISINPEVVAFHGMLIAFNLAMYQQAYYLFV